MESLVRGKRSKRQRPNSSSSSTNHDFYELAVPSPTSGFTGVSGSTEEEEDMAHCLILLARGQTGLSRKPEIQFEFEIPVSETPRMRSFKVVGSDGLLSYQCKTCDRCFPSFQALGGHRASHKIKAKEVSGSDLNRGLSSKQSTISSTALTLEIPNRVNDDRPIKPKVHECTICGVEFASGQALGGHMRRHRTVLGPTTTATATSSTSLDTAGEVSHRPEAKKQRNTQLGLDLNLPAPAEEELREAKFFPAAKEQVLLFSASPLVDCCRY